MARSDKHLIIDVNVIVEFWLNPEATSPLAKLFQAAETSAVQLWVAATALSAMEYVGVRRLADCGVPVLDARRMIGQLMASLFKRVNVLSCFGFEQAEVCARARDLEDAQVAASARALAGLPACIVTNDDSFDTLGELPSKSPAEALIWVSQEVAECSNDVPIRFVDLAAQQAAVRPQVERNIEAVLRHGQYVMGPEVRELEERLAAYVGAKHCIAVSSGTDTLLVAMMALGIGPGDEVITTPFTFVATGEMITLLGAIPVFVDIDSRTYNINSAKIEAAITDKTRAIIPVSLFGQCADMDAINAIAARHGLPVIEDAAQSFGATYKGRKSCGLSTIGSTSFFPSKPLGGYGDGGALFTNDDSLAMIMREIRVHGQDKRYHHPRIGINGRLDTLQAAIILAKLERFDWEVTQRQQVGAVYTAKLMERCSSVVAPYVEPHNTSVYAQYSIQLECRDRVVAKLSELGIPVAIHYPVPLHRQPAYARIGRCSGELSVAEAAASRIVSLPMCADLSEQQQEQVVKALGDAMQELSGDKR